MDRVQARALDPVQNASLTVVAPAEDGLREAAAPISDFFE